MACYNQDNLMYKRRHILMFYDFITVTLIKVALGDMFVI